MKLTFESLLGNLVISLPILCVANIWCPGIQTCMHRHCPLRVAIHTLAEWASEIHFLCPELFTLGQTVGFKPGTSQSAVEGVTIGPTCLGSWHWDVYLCPEQPWCGLRVDLFLKKYLNIWKIFACSYSQLLFANNQHMCFINLSPCWNLYL